MDTVTILRELWRLRKYVAMVCVLALLAGAAVEFKLPSLQSRKYSVGVATANILVDTPSSQVVDLSPKGSDTTAGRADLLASVMIDGTIKATIAQLAGLRSDQVVGMTGAATVPSVGASSASAPPGPQAYVLNTQVLTNSEGNELPIIEVSTQAPTAAGAARLASAAVTGLGRYLDSKAAAERVPGSNRLQVEGLGTPQSGDKARGPSNTIVLIVVAVMLVFGCAAILGIQALIRGWRAASTGEQFDEDQPVALEIVRPSEEPRPMEERRPETTKDFRPPGMEALLGRRFVRSAPEQGSGLVQTEPRDPEALESLVASRNQDFLRKSFRGER